IRTFAHADRSLDGAAQSRLHHAPPECDERRGGSQARPEAARGDSEGRGQERLSGCEESRGQEGRDEEGRGQERGHGREGGGEEGGGPPESRREENRRG